MKKIDLDKEFTKKQQIITCSILISILLFSITYQIYKEFIQEKPIVIERLGDLAFDAELSENFRVYIPENGQLEPYFVVTNDYANQGNTLLVREFVWDKPMKQQETIETSYYGSSLPDRFLNEDFINRFPDELGKKIEFTRVLVRDTEFKPESKSYQKLGRNIFLLSRYELGFYSEPVWDEEALSFFQVYDDASYPNRQAKLIYGSEGENWKRRVSWWLRSDTTPEKDTTNVVLDDGWWEIANTQEEHYVRPAFCLPPRLPVKEIDRNGEKIYVLSDFEFEGINENVFVDEQEVNNY